MEAREWRSTLPIEIEGLKMEVSSPDRSWHSPLDGPLLMLHSVQINTLHQDRAKLSQEFARVSAERAGAIEDRAELERSLRQLREDNAKHTVEKYSFTSKPSILAHSILPQSGSLFVECPQRLPARRPRRRARPRSRPPGGCRQVSRRAVRPRLGSTISAPLPSAAAPSGRGPDRSTRPRQERGRHKFHSRSTRPFWLGKLAQTASVSSSPW